MEESLSALEKRVKTGRNFESPPLELWHPELSGDIPIHIQASGEWYHDGDKITRDSLVRLFASILRREEDGEYYLVTPAEKWRITVELHPLLVTDVEIVGDGEKPTVEAILNTGRRVCIGEENPMFLEPRVGQIAAINLPHGLTALCTRSAWYRLVELATTPAGAVILKSGNYEFNLAGN